MVRKPSGETAFISTNEEHILQLKSDPVVANSTKVNEVSCITVAKIVGL